jgi:hypothetical protein
MTLPGGIESVKMDHPELERRAWITPQYNPPLYEQLGRSGNFQKGALRLLTILLRLPGKRLKQIQTLLSCSKQKRSVTRPICGLFEAC